MDLTRSVKKVRKWIAAIGIVSILSTLVIIAPVASADALDDGCTWALSAGVMTSCDKGGNLTKLAFTVILARLVLGEDLIEDTTTAAFTDVPGTHSANKYLAAAKDAGIVAGVGGCFVNECPSNASNKTLNRCEMATMLANAFSLEESASLSDFADSVPSWCEDGMGKAVQAGLVSGKQVGGQRYLAGVESGNQGQGAVVAQRSNDTFDLGLVAEAAEEEAAEEEAAEEEAAEEEAVVAPGGALTFALSSTPAATTLPLSARGIPVFQFSMSASENTTVSAFKFKREGVGAVADFANVYIYDGVTRLKSGKTISSDTNEVEFTNLELTVSSTPTVLTLKADVAATGVATSNDQHYFVLSEANVESNATSKAGLPLQSNTFTIGAVSVGTVTIQTVSAISGPTLGASNVECGNFRLTAGANDIDFNVISLTHGGTISRSNLGNFKLVQPGYEAEGITDGVISMASAINDKDRLIFTVDPSFRISKNQNRNFEVRCDILGGKTTDTLQLYLDEVTDLDVTDLQYGFGSGITNNLATGNVTAVALTGGKVTFADNGPTAQNLSINSTNKQLFNFSMSCDRNVTVRDFILLLEQTAFDGTGATAQLGATADEVAAGSISTAGALTAFLTDSDRVANLRVNDVVQITDADTGNNYFVRLDTVGAATQTNASTGTVIYPDTTPAATVTLAVTDDVTKVFDNHLRTRVDNIKLVDLDTGGTIASSSNSNYAMQFSDDFDCNAGQTRHLSVQADLDSTLVAANAFRAGIDFTTTNTGSANTIRDNDANEFVAAADLVAGNIFGKIMTAVASSLTVTLASTPVSETHVRGQTDVDAVGFSAQAGDGGPVKVTRVNVRLFGDDDGTFGDGSSILSDTAANTLVSSVGLYKQDGTTYTRLTGSTTDVSSTLVGTIGAANGYYRAQFLNLTHTVAQATTEKWIPRVNLANTISATRYLAVDIDPDDDIVAQDADGNTVTAAGTVGINLTVSATTVVKTIATSGTLAVTEQSSPNAAIVVAGSSDNVVSKYQWSTANEAFTVKKLDVQLPESSVSGDPFNTAAGTTSARSITSVKLRYTDKAGETVTSGGASLSAGVANFTGLSLYVPKNSNATMEILVNLNTVSGGAVTGDSIRLGISTVTGYTFEAVGEGSSATLSTITPSNQANTNSLVLRKSQPVVAKAATGLPSSLLNGVGKVYGFTVKADGGPISLKRLVFTLNASVDSGDQINQFKLFRGSADLSTNVSIRTKYGTDAESTTDITSTNTTVAETITVTFDDTTAREEAIASGVTNTYYLEANVSGASTGNNLSMNIADDTVSMAAAAGVDEFRGTASQQGNVVVWRYDRGATDNTTDLTDDFVYADLNGDGDYTAAADYAFSAANTTEPTTAANAPANNAFLSGPLVLDANSTAADGSDDTIFWDITAGTPNSTFDAASEVEIVVGAIAQPTTAGNALDANTLLTTQTIRSETAGCTGAYIDTNEGAGSASVFDAANDYCLTMTQTTSALAEDTELVTTSMNFVWSDQGEASGTTHATTTSAWTNGLDVDSLATASLSLSF